MSTYFYLRMSTFTYAPSVTNNFNIDGHLLLLVLMGGSEFRPFNNEYTKW